MNVDVRAHRAAADAHATAPDIDTRRRFTDLQHLAQRRRRSQAASLAIVALAAVVVVSLVVTNRDGAGTTAPISPGPVVSSVAPTPTDWFPLQEPGTPVIPRLTWEDPRDTPVKGIDLTRVRRVPNGLHGAWELDLAARPPRPPQIEAGTVISHGLVLDSTHDGIADYLIGIANDAPRPTGTGGYRTWVTNLATNETDEQVGPPYGFPFDWSTDSGKHDGAPTLRPFFIQTPFAWNMHVKKAAFYAWSSLSRDGEVAAWDTAPDNGWLNGQLGRG